MKLPTICLAIAVVFGFTTTVPTQADITDFTNWSLLQSPADPSFTGSATSSAATLFAGATGVTPGTVIAYTSIDGNTPASSTTGYYFDANSDFTIAIDYSFSFNSATGALAFGFGIGEDRTGANSAGAVFAIDDGNPFTNFLATGVINGVPQAVQEMQPPVGSTASGSLFVEYDQASGDITLGASTIPGAGTPTTSLTLSGATYLTNDQPLLASFFMRSEAIIIFAPNGWEGGDAMNVFTNFRVLEGAALAVPEPGSFCLVGAGALALLARRRRTG